MGRGQTWETRQASVTEECGETKGQSHTGWGKWVTMPREPQCQRQLHSPLSKEHWWSQGRKGPGRLRPSKRAHRMAGGDIFLGDLSTTGALLLSLSLSTIQPRLSSLTLGVLHPSPQEMQLPRWTDRQTDKVPSYSSASRL